MKKIFACVAGATFLCAGSVDVSKFELAARQAERIDQDFPGYEEGFYNAFPRGTLDVESLHPDISGDGYKRGYSMKLHLAFYHLARQKVIGTDQNCVYDTVRLRFPFVKIDRDTTVECSPK